MFNQKGGDRQRWKPIWIFEDVDFPTQGGSTRLASDLSRLDLDSAGLNYSDFDHLAPPPGIGCMVWPFAWPVTMRLTFVAITFLLFLLQSPLTQCWGHLIDWEARCNDRRYRNL